MFRNPGGYNLCVPPDDGKGMIDEGMVDFNDVFHILPARNCFP